MLPDALVLASPSVADAPDTSSLELAELSPELVAPSLAPDTDPPSLLPTEPPVVSAPQLADTASHSSAAVRKHAAGATARTVETISTPVEHRTRGQWRFRAWVSMCPLPRA